MEWKTLAEQIVDLQNEVGKLNLQNRELKEQVGNLMDFIGCVRTWAIGQPTAKSIQESCLGILEKYATYSLCECGHNHRTEPGHYVTMNCNLPGCACTYFTEKRKDEKCCKDEDECAELGR